MKTPALVMAALATATLLHAPGASASTAAQHHGQPRLASASEVALTWAPEYMSTNHQYTQAQAVGLAQKYDLIAAMPAAFGSYVSAMKAANPNLKLLAYSNAMYANSANSSGLPESAFAHDSAGHRITSKNFGLTLMEPTSSAWQARSNSLCQTQSTKGHYDGCLLDMLTMAAFTPNYNTAYPAYPGTSTTYDPQDWRSALISVGKSFSNAYPSETFVANAIGNYWSYWHNTTTSQPIAAALQASQMEDFLRGSADPINAYPSVSEWLDNINTITSMENSGRTGYYSTKVWVNQTAAQSKQWQALAISSFLMGANGHSYFAFTDARTQAGATGTNAPYSMPKGLGAASGAMRSTNGLYSRAFANGLSVVNPGKVPMSVTLTGPATDLDGATVTTFTLPANSGQVFRPVGGAAGSQLDVVDATPLTAGVDQTAPLGSISSITSDAQGNVTVTGTASDETALASVTVSVQSNGTKKWLQADGSWATHAKLTPSTSGTGQSVTWTYTFQTAPGTYGVGLRVTDTTQNVNNPAPWKKFVV